MPLDGFKHKQQQQAAAAQARQQVAAAERAQRDRQYDLTRSQEAAATTAIAAGGAGACAAEAATARQAEQAARAAQTGLQGAALRPFKQQVAAAVARAVLLESLAAMDDPGRTNAIQAANLAVTNAQAALQLANATAAQEDAAATALAQAANAIPDLHASWAKDHTAVNSSRALEADLRNMKADLTKLGAAAPPGAVQYCALLETRVDHEAHHVPCPRCNAEHGIPRTPPAKDAIANEVAELERLAGLPNEDGLNEQQRRDRSIGRDLEALRAGGGGKMIGVLLCQDAHGAPVTLRGFSGDIGNRDDVDGWSTHIPPVGQPGSSVQTANGRTVALGALPPTNGTPHGVCAAPKMIQEAHRQGLTIVGIAEAWYGGGNVQPHGALVASCATCKSNLDVQLCPAYP